MEKKRISYEQFKDVNGSIRGIVIYETLFKYFLLLFTLINIQKDLAPTCYELFMDLEITTRKMISCKFQKEMSGNKLKS
jgi:hypothetical protein